MVVSICHHVAVVTLIQPIMLIIVDAHLIAIAAHTAATAATTTTKRTVACATTLANTTTANFFGHHDFLSNAKCLVNDTTTHESPHYAPSLFSEVSSHSDSLNHSKWYTIPDKNPFNPVPFDCHGYCVDGHFGCYLFCLNLHEKGK